MDIYESIIPTGLNNGDDYGAAVEISGDWLFVGAPATNLIWLGKSYVFERINGQYQQRQILSPFFSISPPRFGTALAAEGPWLFVGAPATQQGSLIGSVYVYRLQERAWNFHAKINAPAGQTSALFGFAIDVQENTLIVGAPRSSLHDEEAGAAYVYRLQNDSWQLQQSLQSPRLTAFEHFGAAVVFADNTICVGAPQHADQGFGEGSVYVFTMAGNDWAHAQTFQAPDSVLKDQFGASLAASQSALVVGAPRAAGVQINTGAAYAMYHDNAQWTFAAKLVAQSGKTGDRAGTAVAVSENAIYVGAPFHDRFFTSNAVYYDAGAVFTFERLVNIWQERQKLCLFTPAFVSSQINNSPYECWLQGPPQWWMPMNVSDGYLGRSITLGPDGPMVGARVNAVRCWPAPASPYGGALLLFNGLLADCNDNALADVCERYADCNNNSTPDECEIGVTSQDCDHNQIPDECETNIEYRLSPQQPRWFVYLNSGRDAYWLTQHRVKSGGQYITDIAIPISVLIADGFPVTLLVYGDPTQDGDPSDAILLNQTETTVHPSMVYTLPFVTTPIPPTYVGEAGHIFYIGFRANFLPNSQFPIVWTAGTFAAWRCWWGRSEPGQLLDLHNLSNNQIGPEPWFHFGTVVFSAHSNDCNGNATPDFCDIDGGTSQDANGDGIPDECEAPPCFWADIYPTGVKGDGVVNVNDLLHVISNWGTCSPCYTFCPGDTNDDCHVNLTDLQAVINAWGPCR